MHRILVLALSLLMLTGAAIAVNEPANLLDNGDFEQGASNWNLPNERATTSFVAAKVGLFSYVLRIPVRPQPNDVPWSIVVSQAVDSSFKQKDPLSLKVWLRSPESLKVGGYLEEVKAPNTKWLSGLWTLTPEWKEYDVQGEALSDAKAGETRVVFHLAYGAGTIEMTRVRLFNPNAPADPRTTLPSADKPQILIQDGDFDAGWATAWDRTDEKLLPALIVPADVSGFNKAMRVSTSVAPNDQPWTLQVGQKIHSYVGRGEAVYVQAWMRSPERVHIGFSYELAAPPYPKMISQMVRLSPEWKEYRFVGYAPQTFEPGESQFKIFLGYDKGTAEITGVRVQNFGKAPRSLFHETIDYWNGQDHSDAWRAAALERIEKIRKGDLKIRVVDAAGIPVRGAQVTVEQKQHRFRFGTAGPASRLLDTSLDSLQYQSEVKRLFNTFTFENDLKWQDYPTPNKARMQDIQKAISWLNDNGISNIRAHNLLWGSKMYLPAAVQQLDTTALLKASHDRVTEQATRWRGKVYIWDVVNEATDNTWLWDNIGWENFANAYRWAHEADPKALLAYNDYHGLADQPAGSDGVKREEARIQYLVDHGTPFDVIGEQAHLGPSLIPMDGILRSLDNLAKYHKQIEITEFDLGLPDDEVHGQYYRDFLIAAFSHPAVEGIIQWGFWEGNHWRAQENAAPFRKDWSKRPAEEAYEDLVLNQWWTRASLKTGPDGRAAIRAFYGTHHLTIQTAGSKMEQDVELAPGKSGEVVVKVK